VKEHVGGIFSGITAKKGNHERRDKQNDVRKFIKKLYKFIKLN